MESPASKGFPLLEAYKFAVLRGLSAEVADVKGMEIEWDRSYTSSVRKGRIIELFESRGVWAEFLKDVWPFGTTSRGETLKRRYIRIAGEYKEFEAGGHEEPNEETESEKEGLEFALDAHLRDFLAKNLDRIEHGLHLYEKDGKRGVEFAVDDGRIDLLAVDQHGKYVVIEFKLSQGRNKTLGQLLYYMGWVDSHLGNGPCRGAIIAREITDALKVAVSRAAGVFIARYLMSLTVERVS
jgi:hypothetical protein